MDRYKECLPGWKEGDRDSPMLRSKEASLILSGQVNDNDVMCGRGAGSYSHPGNVFFRDLVAEYKHKYIMAKPIEKVNIAHTIISQVRESGGRFIRRRSRNKSWYELKSKAVQEKVCQALRERDNKATKSTRTTTMEEGTEHQQRQHKIIEARIRHSEVVVNDNDVLFGRGGVTNSHIGNINFRKLVRDRQSEYLALAKLVKGTVAMAIVNEVKQAGGRFLTQRNGEWVEVKDSKAREKTSQALREKNLMVVESAGTRRLKPDSNEEGDAQCLPGELLGSREREVRRMKAGCNNDVDDSPMTNVSEPKDSVARRDSGICTPIVVNEKDVIFGRGSALLQRTDLGGGTRRFEELLMRRHKEYFHTSRGEKRAIAMSIVTEILGEGGRFLKRDHSGDWVELTDMVKVRKLTSRAFGRDDFDDDGDGSEEEDYHKNENEGAQQHARDEERNKVTNLSKDVSHETRRDDELELNSSMRSCSVKDDGGGGGDIDGEQFLDCGDRDPVNAFMSTFCDVHDGTDSLKESVTAIKGDDFVDLTPLPYSTWEASSYGHDDASLQSFELLTMREHQAEVAAVAVVTPTARPAATIQSVRQDTGMTDKGKSIERIVEKQLQLNAASAALLHGVKRVTAGAEAIAYNNRTNRDQVGRSRTGSVVRPGATTAAVIPGARVTGSKHVPRELIPGNDPKFDHLYSTGVATRSNQRHPYLATATVSPAPPSVMAVRPYPMSYVSAPIVAHVQGQTSVAGYGNDHGGYRRNNRTSADGMVLNRHPGAPGLS